MTRSIKKNLVANLLELMQVRGCRINAERGYNTDYEVSKIQMLISKFKDKKNKRKRKQNKRTGRQNKQIKTLINKSKCLK